MKRFILILIGGIIIAFILIFNSIPKNETQEDVFFNNIPNSVDSMKTLGVKFTWKVKSGFFDNYFIGGSKWQPIKNSKDSILLNFTNGKISSQVEMRLWIRNPKNEINSKNLLISKIDNFYEFIKKEKPSQLDSCILNDINKSFRREEVFINDLKSSKILYFNYYYYKQ